VRVGHSGKNLRHEVDRNLKQIGEAFILQLKRFRDHGRCLPHQFFLSVGFGCKSNAFYAVIGIRSMMPPSGLCRADAVVCRCAWAHRRGMSAIGAERTRRVDAIPVGKPVVTGGRRDSAHRNLPDRSTEAGSANQVCQTRCSLPVCFRRPSARSGAEQEVVTPYGHWVRDRLSLSGCVAVPQRRAMGNEGLTCQLKCSLLSLAQRWCTRCGTP
jgi:hypothetical protein